MRVLTIKEVLAMGAGELVPSVKGQVKVIFDAKTGTNDKGEWRIESFVLKDGNDEIIVDLKNREPLDRTWQGKRIYLISHVKTKGGFTGIKRDEYNGKAKLSVTESAEVVRDDGVAETKTEAPAAAVSAPPVRTEAPAAATSSVAQSATAPTPPPASRQAKVEHVITVQKHLGKRVNALRLCADATLRLAKSFMEANGLEYKPADVVPLVARHLCETTFTTMFIDLQKAFLLDDISSSDIDKLLAEARASFEKGKVDKAEAERQAKLARAKQLQEEAARLAEEATTAIDQ